MVGRLVGALVGALVGYAVGNAVGDAVGDAVGAALRTPLLEASPACVKLSVNPRKSDNQIPKVSATIVHPAERRAARSEVISVIVVNEECLAHQRRSCTPHIYPL